MKISKIKKPKLRLWFCDFWFPETEKNIKENVLFQQLEKRFEIVLDSKNPDFLFFSCLGTLTRVFDFHCQKIFITGENICPNFKFCDFAISFDPDVAGRNHYFPLYAWDKKCMLALRKQRNPMPQKKKFCNFIYRGKVPLRENFFHLLGKYKKVDSAGGRLNNTLSGERVKDKLAFMRPYKFSIAFENESFAGYITEKIMHAFEANTVPIYYGNPYIAKHFNPKAFINCHDFENFESVVEHIKKVDQDDELLNSYLQEPPFVDNKIPKAAQYQRLCDALENFFQNPPQKKISNIMRAQFFKYFSLVFRLLEIICWCFTLPLPLWQRFWYWLHGRRKHSPHKRNSRAILAEFSKEK